MKLKLLAKFSKTLTSLVSRLFSPTDARLLSALRHGTCDVSKFIESNEFKSIQDILRAQLIYCPALFLYKINALKKLFKKGVIVAQRNEMRDIIPEWHRKLKALKNRDKARPLLALLVPDGQSARTFLLTSTWKHLNAWADVVVITPYKDIEKLGATIGLPPERIFPSPSIKKMPIDTVLRFAHYRNSESPTHKIFVRNIENILSEKSNKDFDKISHLWETSSSFKGSRQYHKLYEFVIMCHGALTPVKDASALLKDLSPDAVLNTNAISYSSKLWTRAAALNNIPLASFVISWDNISSKWLIDEFADMYLLWSQEMHEDFHKCFPLFAKKKLVITGSPQFEPIMKKTGLLPGEEFFKKHGLRSAVPLVLYTTGSKTTFPAEPECLMELLQRWRKSYRNKMQFMIRMHPKDRYHRYDRVRDSFPEVSFTLAGEDLSADNEWFPTAENIDLLVNQINHSAVGVNVASTMTLEGFAAGKPCINIGFDLGIINSMHYPLKDYYNSRHYSEVVSSGSVRLAQNYDDVFRYIIEYLDNPSKDQQSRNRIFQEKCFDSVNASSNIDTAIRNFIETRQ